MTNMKDPTSAIQKLRTYIARHVLVRSTEHAIISADGEYMDWAFDFRRLFLNPEMLTIATEVFWERFKHKYPFQVGGQEIAAIPFVAAIVHYSQLQGKPVNGFFIRKERKGYDLQNLIEGNLDDNKVILVDDLINSGGTFERLISVLEQQEKVVDSTFTFVRFKEKGSYNFGDIACESLFTLHDFNLSLHKELAQPLSNFTQTWVFQSPNPNFTYVVPKSAPALDEKHVFFGSDGGIFWALDQETGSVSWKYEVGYPAQGKSIFSSPAVHNGVVYFGSYDGNAYALEAETGEKKWVFGEADWVGSSPAVAPELGLVFIGLEFGLLRRRGGIVALHAQTGEKVWEYVLPKEVVHGSPAYDPHRRVVAIGSNDHHVYLFDAKSGKLKWSFKTGGEIKGSLTFDNRRDLLLFGSFDGKLYALNVRSGECEGSYQTRDIIFSTPLVSEDDVFFSSADKRLYSLNLDTGLLNWQFDTKARLLSSPVLIDEHVYIGSNNGILYEIEARTGTQTDFARVTERIVNKIAYSPKMKRFFLPTDANEVYCLQKAT